MTVDPSTIQQELQLQYPGRSKQIETILKLLGEPSDTTPPSIFIYGHPSSGKTSVVTSIFEKTMDRRMWAMINCVECYTPRMLFEHALNQWCGWIPSRQNQFKTICRADNVHQFVRVIQDGVEIDEDTKIRLGDDETRYLILDKAERLRDMGANLLPVLVRLSELTEKNVCVILISTIVFEKFRVKGGAYEPFLIRFPEYTMQDTLTILKSSFPPSKRRVQLPSVDEDDQEEFRYIDLDDDFITNYAELIYSIFNHNCKDLNELRYLAALLFPLYLQPLKDGRAKPQERAKLLKFAQPYFAQATDKLYLREISSAEWTKETHRLEEASMEDTPLDPSQMLRSLRRNRGEFELPYYTKFLLLAAFLASYNPPRLDVRYFARSGEVRTRKKGGGTRKTRQADLGGKMRPQLLGPKAFPVERMLAIFYSIIDDTLEDTIDIETQIASLTSLRLLIRANNMERLEAAKFKCNVSFEFIKTVAASVRFEIGQYLYDFS